MTGSLGAALRYRWALIALVIAANMTFGLRGWAVTQAVDAFGLLLAVTVAGLPLQRWSLQAITVTAHAAAAAGTAWALTIGVSNIPDAPLAPGYVVVAALTTSMLGWRHTRIWLAVAVLAAAAIWTAQPEVVHVRLYGTADPVLQALILACGMLAALVNPWRPRRDPVGDRARTAMSRFDVMSRAMHNLWWQRLRTRWTAAARRSNDAA